MWSAGQDSNLHFAANAKNENADKDVNPAAHCGEPELTEHVGQYFVSGIFEIGYQLRAVCHVTRVFHCDL